MSEMYYAGRSGFHRSWTVYYGDHIDPHIRFEIFFTFRGKILFSIPLWRCRDEE